MKTPSHSLHYKDTPRTNRGHVDGSSGFIHDEDAGLPDEGPSQAEQLPLALAEILPTFSDDGI
jgi:hypothetical protein